MKIWYYILGLVLIILPLIEVGFYKSKKEKIPQLAYVTFLIALIAYVLSILIDNNNEIEIQSLDNKNIELNYKLDSNRLILNKAEYRLDSLKLLITNAELRLSQSEINQLILKKKHSELQNENVVLEKKVNFERINRHHSEREKTNDRIIFQNGPIIDSLRKMDKIDIKILTVDHGEAINVGGYLAKLFERLKWNIDYNPNEFLNRDFFYNNNLLLKDSITSKIDHFILRRYEIQLHACSRKTFTIAQLLETHLLASLTLASSHPSQWGIMCEELKIPPNTLFIVVGYKPYDEFDQVKKEFEFNPQLSIYRNELLDQEIYEFNNNHIPKKMIK